MTASPGPFFCPTINLDKIYRTVVGSKYPVRFLASRGNVLDNLTNLAGSLWLSSRDSSVMTHEEALGISALSTVQWPIASPRFSLRASVNHFSTDQAIRPSTQPAVQAPVSQGESVITLWRKFFNLLRVWHTIKMSSGIVSIINTHLLGQAGES